MYQELEQNANTLTSTPAIHHDKLKPRLSIPEITTARNLTPFEKKN